jgi:lysophospholipid acyltransferase (LPLAT)-like uncharacterized protein
VNPPLRKRAHKAFKRARRRLGGLFLRFGGRHVVAFLSRSWSADVEAEEIYERASAGRGCLVAMWHGRMILPVALFKERGIHVLVSPSEDGDLSERMLESFGYKVVRGSSSRGGAKALRAMLEILDAGGVIVITPDGPRGPLHSVNPGLAWMARATGRSIVPAGMAAGPAWRLRSWDRFTIPKWRARVALTFGEPIDVPRDAKEEDMELATQRIRERVLAAERRSYARLGLEPDL